MRATITKPDGTVIKIKGKPSEIREALGIQEQTWQWAGPYIYPQPVWPHAPYQWPYTGTWTSGTTIDLEIGDNTSAFTFTVPPDTVSASDMYHGGKFTSVAVPGTGHGAVNTFELRGIGPES